MQKAGCAGALAGMVAISVYPDPATGEREGCAALQVLAVLALHDRVPPPGAHPDTEAFVIHLNADLALVRQKIKEVCRGR